MQIVINISEEIYKRALPYKDLPIVSNLANDYPNLTYAVANGTPLPKGHGRLYDEKAIRKGIKNPYQCATVLDGLKLVEPIIEAESEEV